MIFRKTLKKLLITSLTLLILMCFYLIPGKNNLIDKKMDVLFVSNVGSNSIYLLNKDDYLVRTNALITGKSKVMKAKNVIEKLTVNDIGNQKLRGVIPKNVKLLDISIENNSCLLNFSKELLNISDSELNRVIESVVFSLTDLDGISSVVIKISGDVLTNFPNSKDKIEYPLTRNIGINKKYDIVNRNNINKVVVYYIENIDNVNYYVPVTKYVNDDRDKIKIIVDELTSSYIYEPNLMSFLNSKTELLSYKDENGVLFLDFNDQLYGSNNKILEEVIYTLGYSIFENYDVGSFVFSVDGDKIKTVSQEDIKNYSINKK